MVRLDRVFLDLKNPRHKPFDDQSKVIEHLCREEFVLNLAKDIVKNGLNPLELFALLEDGQNTYTVAEGNRRACALMLLADPDLAPANCCKQFTKLSQEWEPIKEIFSIVFKTREEVMLWLDRIHAGINKGKGRSQWNADQKARNSGYAKNTFALALLDLGENRGFITEEERNRRLSTVDSIHNSL